MGGGPLCYKKLGYLIFGFYCFLTSILNKSLMGVLFYTLYWNLMFHCFRSRRYTLNKVMVDGKLPPKVKKDAHDVILDFIRSRPPLKPVCNGVKTSISWFEIKFLSLNKLLIFFWRFWSRFRLTKTGGLVRLFLTQNEFDQFQSARVLKCLRLATS